MVYRPLEVNIGSAKDLKKVNLVSIMGVYVVVSLLGDESSQKFETCVDRSGGSNPVWNLSVKFNVDESLAQQNRLSLMFQIKCQGSLRIKDIGEVTVPVKELLDARKSSGKPKGQFSFSYKFGDKVAGGVAAVGSSSASYVGCVAYPPPPQGAAAYGAYPPPPQGGYVYPPPVYAGYGHAPVQPRRLGVALGVGLLADVLNDVLSDT